MSIRLPPLLLLLLAAMLALATTSAWAQNGRGRGNDDRGQRNERPEARRVEPPMPTPSLREPPQRQQRQQRHRDDALADAIRRVERSTRGQVISAERMQSDGRDISRIKVMDERGRVRVYTDDPQRRQRQPPPPTRGDDD